VNRDTLLELAERIEGNAFMIRRFLHDHELPDHMVALEVLGRSNIIDAKVAQIRSEMARDKADNAPPLATPNLHTLGDREPSYRPQNPEGTDAA
jgi:hypothetical protein